MSFLVLPQFQRYLVLSVLEAFADFCNVNWVNLQLFPLLGRDSAFLDPLNQSSLFCLSAFQLPKFCDCCQEGFQAPENLFWTSRCSFSSPLLILPHLPKLQGSVLVLLLLPRWFHIIFFLGDFIQFSGFKYFFHAMTPRFIFPTSTFPLRSIFLYPLTYWTSPLGYQIGNANVTGPNSTSNFLLQIFSFHSLLTSINDSSQEKLLNLSLIPLFFSYHISYTSAILVDSFFKIHPSC